MPAEPTTKRAIAFFDGQNLFNAAKYAFGYSWPNYDPLKLAGAICAQQGWQLDTACFYTGIPQAQHDQGRYTFWSNKLAQMRVDGVQTFLRVLQYRRQRVPLPGGGTTTAMVSNEKGVDVRIALDVVASAYNAACDVALVFSQDQDLSEVADDVREIAGVQNRWMKIACAYPVGPNYSNRRGINSTDWIQIDKATYDGCLDLRNYRPRRGTT